MPLLEHMLAGGELTDPGEIYTRTYIDLPTGLMAYRADQPHRIRVLGLMLPIPGAADPLPDRLEPYTTYSRVPEGYRNSGYLGRAGINGRRLSDSTYALHGTAEGFRETVGVYETEVDLRDGPLKDLRDRYPLESLEKLAAKAGSLYRQQVYARFLGNEALAERADRQYPLADHILYNQPPDGGVKRTQRHINNPHSLQPKLLIARVPLTKVSELKPLEVTY